MSSTTLVFILLCFVAVNSGSLNKILFNCDYEFIDLTHPFDKDTVYWEYSDKFKFTDKTAGFSLNGSWYAANNYAAAEHGGTHLDAPYHFYREGKQVGEIPLDRLIVPLVIVDVSSLVNDDPNFVLYKHHLDYIINDNNGEPCIIIFKFGWTKFFYTDKYLNYNATNKSRNFPGLSAEIAEWITTSHKNVVGCGVDTASMDPGSSADFPVHRIFSKAGLYHMESVKLAEMVPEYGCTALVMPMKIAEGTGAPLRLVAICPKSKPTKFC